MEKCDKIIFVGEAEKVYEYLIKNSSRSKEARMLLKGVNYKIAILKSYPGYGDNIPKKLIPKEYILKHNIKKLFRVELPCFWRMLYTIKKGEIEIVAFVVDILDHKKYNKKFGYK